MDRRDVLIAVLAAAEGRAYQPVQIQKAMFLLARNLPELVDEGPHFAFEPYDYGPFDANVYNVADELRREGLADIGQSNLGHWKTYAATGAGIRDGNRVLEAMTVRARTYLREVSAWVLGQSFSSLVRSIYDAYPDMRVNSVFRG